MENHSPLKQAGQASIEFILLLVVVLLLLQTIVLPNIAVAEKVMTDTQTLSRASLAGHELAQAINQVNAGAVGTRQTVSLLMDDRIFLGCATNDDPNIPAEWKPQRVSFQALLGYTENPPASLPGDWAIADTRALTIQNGGGCQVHPAGDHYYECGSSASSPVITTESYLKCYGTIPVNVDCRSINDLDAISLKSSAWCNNRHDPAYRKVSVEKTTTGVSISVVP